MLFLVDNGALLEVFATSAYDAADLALLPAIGQPETAAKTTSRSISVYRCLGVREIGRLEGESFDELYTGSLLPEAIFTTPESSSVPAP